MPYSNAWMKTEILSTFSIDNICTMDHLIKYIGKAPYAFYYLFLQSPCSLHAFQDFHFFKLSFPLSRAFLLVDLGFVRDILV